MSFLSSFFNGGVQFGDGLITSSAKFLSVAKHRRESYCLDSTSVLERCSFTRFSDTSQQFDDMWMRLECLQQLQF